MYAVPTDRHDQSYYFTIFYDTYFILSPAIVSTPLVAGGLVIFRNFPGGLGNFWSIGGEVGPLGGAPKARGALDLMNL